MAGVQAHAWELLRLVGLTVPVRAPYLWRTRSAHNYESPGRSRLWVFAYIVFGWIGMCGTCLSVAKGILAKPGEELLTGPRLVWQVPLAAAAIAVVLDLFIDPVAVAAGYWVWRLKGSVYYGIPLLSYAGRFVPMLLAPLGWMLIEVRITPKSRVDGASRHDAALMVVTLMSARYVSLAALARSHPSSRVSTRAASATLCASRQPSSTSHARPLAR